MQIKKTDDSALTLEDVKIGMSLIINVQYRHEKYEAITISENSVQASFEHEIFLGRERSHMTLL
jgi:hypothetical protein